MNKPTIRWLYAPIALAYAAMLYLFSGFVADDAYIVAHYARRFFQTGAISFNDGDSISALTSPLHFFIEVILYTFTGSLVPAWRVFSIGCALVAAYVLSRRFDNPTAKLVGVVAILMPPQLVGWTMGGLDTLPVMLGLTILLALVYDHAEFGTRRIYPVMIVAGLMFLTRYDSVLASVPVVLYAIYRTRNSRHVLQAAAIGAILPLAWLAYAQFTFGDIFPTSYHTKQPTLNWTPRGRYFYGLVAQYVSYHVLSLPGVWLLLALLGGLAVLQPRQLPTAALGHVRRLWWLYMLAPGLMIYGLLAATTHMMFTFRLLIPYVTPISALLVADWYQHNRFEGVRWQPLVRYGFSGVVVATLVLQLLHGHLLHTYAAEGVILTTTSLFEPMQNHTRIVDVSRDAGRAIAAHWQSLDERPSDRPYVVTFMGGIVPYEVEGAYVYEVLAAWRSECPFANGELERAMHHAHYIHYYIIHINGISNTIPHDVEELFDDYEHIPNSSSVLAFDNGMVIEFGVIFNPDAEMGELPPKVHDPCDESQFPLYSAKRTFIGT